MLRDSGGSVLFRGAGTKMSWAGRPRDPDLVLETGGLDRLLDHNPADMTASAQAGMPLRVLQDRLGEAGQWLALDPPTEPDGATLGGLLATGDSGPRRLRYGALRDLVIGVTLVLPDGTVARAGGHVIKNVAGYDLSKLMYGSLGTLGLIAEVVLRLHPLPETSATVVAASTVQEATARSVDLLASPLAPTAIDWVGDPRGASGRLAVRFEGSAAGVAAQTTALRKRLEATEVLVDTDEAALWRANASAHRAESEQSTAFAGTLPTRLTDVAAALAERGRRRRGGRLAGLPAARSGCTPLGFPDRPRSKRRRSTSGAAKCWRSAGPCCCDSAPPRSTQASTRSVPRPLPSACFAPSKPGLIPTAAAPLAALPLGCDHLDPGVRR